MKLITDIKGAVVSCSFHSTKAFVNFTVSTPSVIGHFWGPYPTGRILRPAKFKPQQLQLVVSYGVQSPPKINFGTQHRTLRFNVEL